MIYVAAALLFVTGLSSLAYLRAKGKTKVAAGALIAICVICLLIIGAATLQ